MFAPIFQCNYPLYLLPCFISRSLTLLLTQLLAGTLDTQSSKDIQDIPALELGKPIERELARGQSHSYRIFLASDQYFHVIVDQRGVGVVVARFGPDDSRLIEVNKQDGTQGSEGILLIVNTVATYRLEARPLETEVPQGDIK